MTDICVDSNELEALLSELSRLEAVLNMSASKIRSQINMLSSELEGRQFVKANKITNQSCTITNETCANVQRMKKYLSTLITCINEYSTLTYQGD